MPDLFEEEVGVDDFALPGDDKILGRVTPEPEAAEAEAAVEEPVAEETATEEAPAEETTETTTEAPTLYAGKYKSVEELERAVVEQQQMFNRRDQEVSELRATVQQLAEAQQAPAPVEVTADMIETNPAYAAQLAYEQNNGVAFTAAFEAWKELDPATAGMWAATKQAEDREQQLRAEYDAKFQRLAESLGPVAETSAQQEAGRLAAGLADKLPGFSEFVANTAAVTKLASEFPDEAARLTSGRPDETVGALHKLFLIQRGRESDTHQVTQEQVARDTATAAQQAREDAYVASATTAANGVKPSAADNIQAEWDAMEAPYRDGWNV